MGNNNGCLECLENPDYIISVKTGDTKGAGLHNSADIILINDRNEKSRKIQLSGCCVTVFKKGRTDAFKVKKLRDFGSVRKIIIEQHKEQNDVEWFIDKITVRHIGDETEAETVFPVHRWLRMNRPLIISEYDACLPQHESNKEQRVSELKMKRIIYGYRNSGKDLPPQMKNIPRDEIFSNFYKWDIMQKRADIFTIYQIPDYEKPEPWKSFEEMENLFKDKGKFRRPKVLDEDWKSDIHFGRQRLCGCNSKSIKLCKEIPENFAVDNDVVEESSEGFSLREAMEKNKLFIVNHSILNGIYDAESNQVIPSPMALFYLNKSEDLIPIAIQLYQEKGEHNPVFVPNDPYYTWLLAKMWFNNADAVFQRVCLLTTSSQWMLESISLSIHRQLSPSHPIFRLLAPYLRLVLAINHFEMHPLISPGGWADQNMTINAHEITELIRKYWQQYEFDCQACIRKELEEHEVMDADIIAEYPFRDDSLLLNDCIKEYVKQLVEGYYETEEDMQQDYEIQGWAGELVSLDSCNIKSMPGAGKFESKDDLIKVLTCIIFKTTVEHASLNLPLYDECSFVPNYPLMMRGKPPQNKDSLSETDVMDSLPTKHVTMEIIAINKIMSERDTSGISDSRTQYQYDLVSKPARERFLGALRETAAIITVRNRKRKAHYDYLNPASSKAHLIN